MDAFIERFQAAFTPTDKSSGGGPFTRIVEAGGLSVRTLSVGEGAGTPGLLLHGFGSDLMSWLVTQEALAEARAVHSFDLPGHGRTAKAIAAGGVRPTAPRASPRLRRPGSSLRSKLAASTPWEAG